MELDKIYESNYEELDFIIREINGLVKKEEVKEKENMKLGMIEKECYKKGFVDGVNLIIECLRY